MGLTKWEVNERVRFSLVKKSRKRQAIDLLRRDFAEKTVMSDQVFFMSDNA